MKTLSALLILVFATTTGIGQKLKSDHHEVILKSIEKEEINFLGKKMEVYVGTIKVKSKGSGKEELQYFFPKRNGEFSHLTILTEEENILKPRLFYNQKNKSFTFHKDTPNEGSKKVLSNESVEEIVLSGALIWLELDNKN